MIKLPVLFESAVCLVLRVPFTSDFSIADAVNSTTLYFAGAHGLSRADRNPSTGVWGYRSNTQVTGLKYVCVSNDGMYVYAATDTRVFVYNAFTLAHLNNGNPLVTLDMANQFRGLVSEAVVVRVQSSAKVTCV